MKTNERIQCYQATKRDVVRGIQVLEQEWLGICKDNSIPFDERRDFYHGDNAFSLDGIELDEELDRIFLSDQIELDLLGDLDEIN